MAKYRYQAVRALQPSPEHRTTEDMFRSSRIVRQYELGPSQARSARLRRSTDAEPVHITNAERHVWGEVSDGWRLLDSPQFSVIEARVPTEGPGDAADARGRKLDTFARQKSDAMPDSR